ncbi:S26 family signal peptidase [Streptomyces sp. NPDC051569]|uniref:S26 family signal peptidase n=1 Tax=Streptomyces sp. NPDC051569 TaxID=3365661 RepID=UPI0037A8CBAE
MPVIFTTVIASVVGTALTIHWAVRSIVLVTVQGLSMKPTLQNGDRVLVWRGRLPERGQIVVVQEPSIGAHIWPSEPAGLGCPDRHPSRQRWLIKRVAAIAGDPVLPGQLGGTHTPGERVPEGHYILLGDNPRVSLDSRQVGFFPCSRILGKVWRKI